jgi:hypothetical protein
LHIWFSSAAIAAKLRESASVILEVCHAGHGDIASPQDAVNDESGMPLHWFNATVCLVELTTGLALLTGPGLRVMPWWYINIVQGIFGARGNMLQFHIAAGIAWMVVFVAYATFGFHTYLRRKCLCAKWDSIRTTCIG